MGYQFNPFTGTLDIVEAGSGGVPGGSDTQVQYNSSGAFAGVSGSVVGATGDITLSLNGAASTPPLRLTGTWFSGGTGTTTKPQVLIEPSGTTSTAWSTSGTGLGVNAASGFSGNLLDLQVNGASKFKVETTVFTFLGHEFRSDANALVITSSGGTRSLITRSDFSIIPYASYLGWGDLSSFASDLKLYRDAANTLAQRNGANAQTYRLYNTLTGTDVSATGNYERAYLGWDTNVFKIGTQVGSGGGTPRNVEISGPSASSKLTFSAGGIATSDHVTISSALRAGGTTIVAVNGTYQLGFTSTSTITSSVDTGLKRDQAGVVALTNGSTGVGYLKATPVVVSALPAATTVGAGTRGFVSDSTVAASGNFGATVTGGGSNKVPVFSDGTNWLIG